MKFIGDVAGLPERVRRAVRVAQDGEEGARDGGGGGSEVRLTLVIALNYSARWEITEAARRAAEQVVRGGIGEGGVDDITPDLIQQHLATAGMPDPELLIRTSGEVRLSNFLLWQLAYTELYFTPVLWPQFGREQFLEALREYGRRDRRFGKI